ncbi:MAG: hypothetical protein GY778_13365 [bacterium]|nr:hypothetical protein [bacterium]
MAQRPLTPKPANPPAAGLPDHLRPTGLSAVELAAKRGIGPLSPVGQRVWHGNARPCVSCGQLVERRAGVCEHCGQELNPDVLAKMGRHSGPWYVLEHVRPFPGVSLERLIRQVRRGVLTPTTVVRGPTTFHQWRFAAETPVLSKYLGCCWACQSNVVESDIACIECGRNLNGPFGDDGEAVVDRTGDTDEAVEAQSAAFVGAGAAAGAATVAGHADELAKLRAAVTTLPAAGRMQTVSAPATVGRVRVSWIVAALLVLIVAAVLVMVQIRAGVRDGTPDEAPPSRAKTTVPDLSPSGQPTPPAATAPQPTTAPSSS